jgi:hypothetical protein
MARSSGSDVREKSIQCGEGTLMGSAPNGYRAIVKRSKARRDPSAWIRRKSFTVRLLMLTV